MNKDKDFIKALLSALEEKEVIKAIKRIVAKEDKELIEIEDKQKRIEELESQLQEYKTSLESKQSIVEELKDKKNRLETDNKQLKNRNLELKRSIQRKEEEIKRLSNRFQGIEEVYNTYLNLSSKQRQALQGIFKGNSIDEFIFCGVQHENVDSLWEYIKREVIEGHEEGLTELEKIFRYFFVAHNKIYANPLYKIQEVETGEEFDEDKHIRGKNSKVRGRITDVLFKGYINLNTDRVVKKSVVRI
ncbi:hypothetical protein JCM16358_25340 [Halanaerocella petrolearia]